VTADNFQFIDSANRQGQAGPGPQGGGSSYTPPGQQQPPAQSYDSGGFSEQPPVVDENDVPF